MSNELKENTVATVHYTGTIPKDGRVFDSSLDRDPLTFLVGHKQMIPGFEREMLGAKVGEKREFTLSSEDAYGAYMEEAVQQVPLEMFGEIAPEPGMTLMSDIGPLRVTKVDDNMITVDFNHELAGEDLTFNVEVVKLRDASQEEIAHGHVHGPEGVEH